ncbi:MAG: hypothetical protein KY459_09380 [Acidobacteria bacterium]|nr:hypothetical protein [Acidobacteriota bacterium]
MPDESVFQRIEGRNTADYLMRTVQQHHVQISAMADTKANILITVSSIVLTLAISRLTDDELKGAFVTLTAFSLLALLLAIIAILPKLQRVELTDGRLGEGYNLLFFGHFQALEKDVFDADVARTLETDAAVYAALANDIYLLGKYLYIRYAYIALLIGFVASAMIGIASIMLH